MILQNIISVLFLLPLLLASPQNSTDSSQNKSKRTTSEQTFNYGDAKGVLFYMESPQTGETPEMRAAASSPGLKTFYSPSAKPLALVSVQQPIQVFEQDNQKQVAEQQVLYEFQQTPTNAVSNVHVKQLFQPSFEVNPPSKSVYQGQSSDQYPSAQPLDSIQPPTPIANQYNFRPHPYAPGFAIASTPNPGTSGTLVSPIQHGFFTNHGLNPGAFNQNQGPNPGSFNFHNPLLPAAQQYQGTQISPKQSPGKYIYLNGKIVYNPTHIIPHGKIPQDSVYHKGVYHNQQKLPLLIHAQRQNPQVTQQGNIRGNQGHPYVQHAANVHGKSSTSLPPITNSGFQPPKELQQIEKPAVPVQTKEAEEEEEEEESENDEDDKEAEDDDENTQKESRDDEKESDENEEDDTDTYETFPFETDDYLNEDENHFFKPSKHRANKYRNKYHGEESEYEHDDDREDTNRGASKQHEKFYHQPDHSRRYRTPPKFDKGGNKGFYEVYSSNNKFKSPRHGKKNGKKSKFEKPSGKYMMKVKYSKTKGSKPRVEKIVGKFSENIPVTHKHKLYKERWFVSKDIEGEPSNKIMSIA